MGGTVYDHVLLRPGTDRIFRSLLHRRRRLILLLLKQGRLDRVADVPPRRGFGRDGLERALVHNHLPRLAEAGYIEWDRETGAISKGPQFAEIEALLEVIETSAEELSPEWP